MNTLARMSAVDAIDDSLQAENAAMEREADALHRELHGDKDGKLPSGEGEGDDPMRLMAARDIHLHPKESTAPVAAVAKPAGLSWPKVIGAALLASGLGAGGLAGFNALRDGPPAVDAPPAVNGPQTDRWMEYDIQKWVPEKDTDTATDVTFPQ